TPMVYPSWGISVIYALVDKLGGIEALYLFHRLIFLLFQILVFRRIRRLRFSDWRFGAVAVLAICGATFFCDRPAMIPMVFVVIMTSLIEKLLSAPKKYFSLLQVYLLIALWANIHGSVLFSLIYVAMFVFYDFANGSLRTRYGIYLLLSLVVFIGTISTPFGALIYPYS